MKTLFALLLMTSAACAHDIYTELMKTSPCYCGNELADQLCEPVQATLVPVKEGKMGPQYYLPVSGEYISVALALPSPDDRFHRCRWADAPVKWRTLDGYPPTRCFFAPVIGF